MFAQIFNAQLLADAVGITGTVYMLAGLGYLFTDRAGVFNIAVEGLLLFSAFFAAVGSGITGNAYAGMAAGIGASLIVSIIFFLVSIGLRADIIVVGIAINLLAGGITVFLLNHWFGSNGVYQPSSLQALPSFSVPGLDRLPVIGATFSNQSLLTYCTWMLVPLSHILLYRTPLGLYIRAVGENAEAAATVGIRVVRTQFLAVMICAVLVGLGGCYLSIGPLPGFNRDMSGGRGWIALAAETLGRGTPTGTFMACVLFGGSEGVASNMQAANIGAGQLAHSVPYLATLVGLAAATRRRFYRRRTRRGTPASSTVSPAEAQTQSAD